MSGRKVDTRQRVAKGCGPGARPSRRAPRAEGTLNVKRRVIQPRGRAGQGGGRAPLLKGSSPWWLLEAPCRCASRADSGPRARTRRGESGKWRRAWPRDLPLCVRGRVGTVGASPLDAARADARWVRPPMERPRGTNIIARKKRRQKGSGACFVLGVRSEDPGKVVTYMEIVNTVVGTAEA